MTLDKNDSTEEVWESIDQTMETVRNWLIQQAEEHDLLLNSSSAPSSPNTKYGENEKIIIERETRMKNDKYSTIATPTKVKLRNKKRSATRNSKVANHRRYTVGGEYGCELSNDLSVLEDYDKTLEELNSFMETYFQDIYTKIQSLPLPVKEADLEFTLNVHVRENESDYDTASSAENQELKTDDIESPLKTEKPFKNVNIFSIEKFDDNEFENSSKTKPVEGPSISDIYSSTDFSSDIDKYRTNQDDDISDSESSEFNLDIITIEYDDVSIYESSLSKTNSVVINGNELVDLDESTEKVSECYFKAYSEQLLNTSLRVDDKNENYIDMDLCIDFQDEMKSENENKRDTLPVDKLETEKQGEVKAEAEVSEEKIAAHQVGDETKILENKTNCNGETISDNSGIDLNRCDTLNSKKSDDSVDNNIIEDDIIEVYIENKNEILSNSKVNFIYEKVVSLSPTIDGNRDIISLTDSSSNQVSNYKEELLNISKEELDMNVYLHDVTQPGNAQTDEPIEIDLKGMKILNTYLSADKKTSVEEEESEMMNKFWRVKDRNNSDGDSDTCEITCYSVERVSELSLSGEFNTSLRTCSSYDILDEDITRPGCIPNTYDDDDAIEDYRKLSRESLIIRDEDEKDGDETSLWSSEGNEQFPRTYITRTHKHLGISYEVLVCSDEFSQDPPGELEESMRSEHEHDPREDELYKDIIETGKKRDKEEIRVESGLGEEGGEGFIVEECLNVEEHIVESCPVEVFEVECFQVCSTTNIDTCDSNAPAQGFKSNASLYGEVTDSSIFLSGDFDDDDRSHILSSFELMDGSHITASESRRGDHHMASLSFNLSRDTAMTNSHFTYDSTSRRHDTSIRTIPTITTTTGFFDSTLSRGTIESISQPQPRSMEITDDVTANQSVPRCVSVQSIVSSSSFEQVENCDFTPLLSQNTYEQEVEVEREGIETTHSSFEHLFPPNLYFHCQFRPPEVYRSASLVDARDLLSGNKSAGRESIKCMECFELHDELHNCDKSKRKKKKRKGKKKKDKEGKKKAWGRFNPFSCIFSCTKD